MGTWRSANGCPVVSEGFGAEGVGAPSGTDGLLAASESKGDPDSRPGAPSALAVSAGLPKFADAVGPSAIAALVGTGRSSGGGDSRKRSGTEDDELGIVALRFAAGALMPESVSLLKALE